ncbi:phospholipase effector Tle1 domain-containing protein [Castellaniella sp. S9]|uniref:phospholipase effector Tle1 domain-containing protein n=1 Tax=Castellaniella sp. S9 TaxID=2993652 RepID=UPI0022B580A8|nr:DUF2235 domain-containing protein [Castellaniella sp. S9]
MPVQPARRAQPLSLILVAWFLAGGTPAGAQGMCHAPAQGLPCGSTQTSPPLEPGLNLGIGNPVHAATGRKTLHDIDLPAPHDGRYPALARIHRPGDASPGPWGAGWHSEYDLRLTVRGKGWRLIRADGTPLRFGADGRAAEPAMGRIEVSAAGHLWRWPDGTTLAFDAAGRLSVLRSIGRAPIRIVRHADGRLAGAIDRIAQGGASLRFHYDASATPPRVTHIDTPAGRLAYRYGTDPEGGARLLAVIRPDGMQRRYLYEAERQSGHAHAITGIELADRHGRTVRVRTWAYDAAGRVAQAIPGPPGQTHGRLRILYPDQTGEAGLTRVLGAQGSRTDLRHAIKGGRHVLRAVHGDGCPGCAPPGLRAEYDPGGRIAALDGLRLDRDAGGRIVRMTPAAPGWPGLVLENRPGGRGYAWHSALTGATRIHHAAGGPPTRIEHANGDRLDIVTDRAVRPVALEARRGNDSVRITLDWRGPFPARIHHPAETESLRHDGRGRVVERRVRRTHPAGELRYAESFAYDGRGRLVRHGLPEGGALHYAWAVGARLSGIVWETPGGERRTVIETVADQPGYRYGNGLHLVSHAGPDGRADTLLLRDGDEIRWLSRRRHAPSGLVRHSLEDVPEAGYGATRRYAYDAQGRLTGLRERLRLDGESGKARESWLAWHGDGALLADVRRSPDAGAGRTQAIQRDASGLPTRVGPLDLRYGPQRRLARVERAGRILAEYAHNGRGQQIRRTGPGGDTELYYLDNRVAAVWHRPATAPDKVRPPVFGVSQRFIYAHEAPVGLIQTGADGIPRLYAVHADLLGAPRLVTDADRRLRWLADMDAGGRATRLAGDLTLDLRLPGQFHDPATGWHDNIFRSYLPEAMHYLEPDPLGPVPGQQALGYAGQQPMRHVDPLGLLLMAFDGTRNDRVTGSNVWKLSQRYADGPVHYHAGPGNEAYLDWDAVTAASAGQIVRNQWQSLLNTLAQAQRTRQPVPIDILGYSRGAALARHFANRIAAHTQDGWFSIDDPLRGTIGLCIDLRFMGLFDSVAQFGLLGAQNAGYELGIAQAWQWVAHAVALHEYRMMFPLLSADGAGHPNTVEAPFIGAHADIGGGMRLDHAGNPVPDGDLSDVALNWILWQARAALVPFADLAPADRQVTEALLHDERLAWQRTLSDGDRAIQDSRGTVALMAQGRHAHLGDARRRELEATIRRLDGWRTTDGNVVGEVDMQGYEQWLEAALGLRM